jgi:hypothetical protein
METTSPGHVECEHVYHGDRGEQLCPTLTQNHPGPCHHTCWWRSLL